MLIPWMTKIQKRRRALITAVTVTEIKVILRVLNYHNRKRFSPTERCAYQGLCPPKYSLRFIEIQDATAMCNRNAAAEKNGAPPFHIFRPSRFLQQLKNQYTTTPFAWEGKSIKNRLHGSKYTRLMIRLRADRMNIGKFDCFHS